MTTEIPENVEQFLTHHGVKGMHWGVHRQRLLELHTRVANGTASRREKFVAANQMSAVDIAKHKGSVTSYSRQQAQRLQAQKDRVQSGHGTARDRLGLAASLTGEDLVRKAISKPRKDKEAAFHADVDEFLSHFGVKGMHWGVRRGAGTPTASHVSVDSARATDLKAKVKKTGTKSLSNDEFEDLLKRLGLETRYEDLSKKTSNAGEKFLNEILDETKSFGKQEAKKYAQANAARAGKFIAKRVAKKIMP